MKHPKKERPSQDEVQVRLESLAHGGEAVGHHQGMAVFVAGGVPGDLVRVSLQVKGRFARARLLEVLEPAPGRMPSDCAIHPACGGCPWMEVPSGMGLAAKGEILTSAFIHLGRMPLDRVTVRPPLGAPKSTRYRHRARLHAQQGERGPTLGFLPARGRGVIEVQQCSVLELPLERALAAVAAVLRKAPAASLDVALSCEPLEHGGKVGIVVDTRGPPDQQRWRVLAAGLWNDHRIAVQVEQGGQVLATAGELELQFAVAPGVAGGPFSHDAACFTQGNRAQNLALLSLVEAAVAPSPADHILELHAGCGNFTLALAQHAAKVTAVESHPKAVHFAGRNAARAGLDSRVHAVTGNANHLPTLQRAVNGRVDVLLLDPPRPGAPVLAATVKAFQPQRVVYVSCNPATLARDVVSVLPLGYVLKSLQAVDLFPRTWHVEAVAVLEKRP